MWKQSSDEAGKAEETDQAEETDYESPLPKKNARLPRINWNANDSKFIVTTFKDYMTQDNTSKLPSAKNMKEFIRKNKLDSIVNQNTPIKLKNCGQRYLMR